MYKDIVECFKNGQLHAGGQLLKDALYENPDDVEGWLLLARFCIDTESMSWAYPVAWAAVQKEPNNYRAQVMLGSTLLVLQKTEEAAKVLKRALKKMPDDEPERNKAMLYRVYANCMVQGYNFDAAEHYAKKSLAIEDHHQAHVALGFAKLHQRKWEEGWHEYTYQLGTSSKRPKHSYDLPEWQGEGHASVLYYGDQGLGDQIAYMSAATHASEINCHPKLKTLFENTFLDSTVYGQQTWQEVTFEPTSEMEVSMAQAMEWQEVKRRGRFLRPTWDKKTMARAVLQSYSLKPKIGIAWTGGALGSDGWRTRNLTLEQLEPILSLPYTFVSLEYREPEETDDRVLEFPYFTRTDDLDDAAALIDELDAVISVPTTAYHVAGGLGKPCAVLVHDQPHFHEGVKGDCPWWESVEFFRRPELGTDGAINAVREWLLNTVEVKDESFYRDRPEKSGSVQRASVEHSDTHQQAGEHNAAIIADLADNP